MQPAVKSASYDPSRGRIWLFLLLPGEIHERGEMLHNLTALIPNSADEDGGPEHAAVLATVANFLAAVRAALERGLNLRQHL
jgi:hypothetical protein